MKPSAASSSEAPTVRPHCSPGHRPGSGRPNDQALKGRPNRTPLERPFRAGIVLAVIPGAMPRAVMGRAVGPNTTPGRTTLTTEAQHAIDLLVERRTALISAAVTGQIDVRNVNS